MFTIKQRRFIFIIFFTVIFLLVCRTFWVLSHTLTPDFSVYHQAAVNMLHAQSVYFGKTSFTLFAYPLVSALFFIPFFFLPYQAGQTVFLICNLIALGIISFLMPVLVTGKRSFFFSALVFSFAYLSFPTKFTLGMGQVNLIAYMFVLVSLYVYALPRSDLNKRVKVRSLLVAFFFVLACVLKPILGFLLLFFILQKQWKTSVFMIPLFAGVFLLSLLIDHHALQDYFYYVQHVIPEVSRPIGKGIYYNQGLMSFVFRTINDQTTRLFLSYFGMATIFIAGIISIVKNKNYIYRFCTLLSMLPLLDTMSWQHHFVVLILPFALCVLTFWKKKLWIQLGLTCLAYLLTSWNFSHPELLKFPFTVALSNTFFGALFLFLLLVFSRKTFSK